MQEYIAFIPGRDHNKKESAIKTQNKKNCFLAGKFFLIGSYNYNHLTAALF